MPVILDVTLEGTVQSAYETITKDLEQHALMLVGLVNCAGLSRCIRQTKNSEKSILPDSGCFNSHGGFFNVFCSSVLLGRWAFVDYAVFPQAFTTGIGIFGGGQRPL